METNEQPNIKDTLRPLALDLFNNGLTEHNCIDTMTMMQSIVECSAKEVYDSIDFAFFMFVLKSLDTENAIFKLVRNLLTDKFLYLQYVKVVSSKETSFDQDDATWEVKTMVKPGPNGTKTKIRYNLNTKTGEEIVISKQKFNDPQSVNIDEIFSGLLSQKESSDVVLNENDL